MHVIFILVNRNPGLAAFFKSRKEHIANHAKKESGISLDYYKDEILAAKKFAKENTNITEFNSNYKRMTKLLEAAKGNVQCINEGKETLDFIDEKINEMKAD
ncbi:hypothetical protein EG68_05103 [Paragonimus skrjabini miyazakii]|uniref:Uncharacterized protein n=1 Tax=Paragonimus skrjabini miyazakii TaxID=59628 RepID=A0A8S9YYF2_9TREM|nr:hypothetical protein EG68_05103 [Paragonimus skrjabini miyazakii]